MNWIIITFRRARAISLSLSLAEENDALCIPAYATPISWTSDYQQPREFSRYVTRVQTEEDGAGTSYDDNAVFLHGRCITSGINRFAIARGSVGNISTIL